MEKINIKVIGTVGLPPKYGGWETLVNFLCEELSEEFSIEVFCSTKKYKIRLKEYNGAKLRYIPMSANGVSSIFYDLISMVLVCRTDSVKLILGVSGCIFLPILRFMSKGPFVVNIDGLEWRRAKWGFFTRKFLKLSEAIAVRFADVVVVDNIVLSKYVDEEYRMPSVMIPYGGNHCRPLPISDDLRSLYGWIDTTYGFKVARIEPENNIEIILVAFSRQNLYKMVIVGNWSDSAYGRRLREKYDYCEMLVLIDAIYDSNILDQMRSNAYFYVHGHSAGGTNPSLVEAMSLGLPIFAYDVNFNRATTFEGAFYFTTADELLDAVMNTSDVDLKLSGRCMFDLAAKNYDWRIVAGKYRSIFMGLSE